MQELSFLADANGNPTSTCNPGENLTIGLSGEGLGDATMKNWTGGEPGQGTGAKYQLNGNWMTFSTRGSAWKLPANASGTNRIRLYIKGNNLADGPIAVRGLTTEHEIEFAVNCN